MLQGIRTIIYEVSDIAKAKEWYSEVLGKAPYFDEPYYVGFNVGGYELGLDPNAPEKSGQGGVRAYWAVDDAQGAFDRLIELGATEHSAVQDVGEGILVGSVLDPFGNILGIIFNPHFSLEGEQ